MNVCGPGSFMIRTRGAVDIDVYRELEKTQHVPCVKHVEGVIDYGTDVQDAIMKFIQLGGYADLSLGEYLDELWATSCKKPL